MTAADVIAALGIPSSARVDRRVPKTLLAERAASTAADKRAITNDIESLVWLAALKPGSVGIPPFRDDERSYEEVEVMSLTLRDVAKRDRLTELVHRSIPYPVLLITDAEMHTAVTAVHVRWSQAEAEKTVLVGGVVQAVWERTVATSAPDGFRSALSLSALPSTSLLALYEGWMDVIVSFQAWRVTGVFTLPRSPLQAEARREALVTLAQLDAEVTRLRSEASRTTQVARRADINVALKRLREARAAAEANL
jgi:hypothetical protein